MLFNITDQPVINKSITYYYSITQLYMWDKYDKK